MAYMGRGRSAARLGALLLVTMARVGGSLAHFGRASVAVAQKASPPITIGALLNPSQGAATLGRNSQAALSLAVQDINAELQTAGSTQQVALAVEDTRFDPLTALQQAQALAAQGIQVAIGPETSAEAQALLPWANDNGFIVLSHGSTSSALALPDDNLLRLVPDDSYEMQAIAALLQHDGISSVVPMWRDDAGNRGLHDSLTRRFPEVGGTVLEGTSYAIDTHDYSGALATVHSQVQEAEQQYGAGRVAVVLASFDEAAQIFDAAQNDALLASVPWYGTDGVAQSAALTRDPQAAAFAEKVGFPCANLGLDPQARGNWGPLSDRIMSMTGQAPDAAALAAYDGAWLAALAYLETGPAPAVGTLRQTIVDVADRDYGATGRTALNAAGDRNGGDYAFSAVRDAGSGPTWVLVNTYQEAANGAGEIAAPSP